MEACLAALQHATDADSPGYIAWHRLTLVRLLLERGETAQALARSAGDRRESWCLLGEREPRGCVVDALELAAALLAIGQQAECAARLLGAASALRAAMPRLMSVREHAMLARDREAITAMLGEPAFTQAWTVGAGTIARQDRCRGADSAGDAGSLGIADASIGEVRTEQEVDAVPALPDADTCDRSSDVEGRVGKIVGTFGHALIVETRRKCLQICARRNCVTNL